MTPGSILRVGYRAVRPALFRISGGDAESAHTWTLNRLGLLDRSAALRGAARRITRPVADPVTLFGVRFANRVGLAAGLAKNGEALLAWPALGFGFAEIGTVTWHAQPGNPTPRLFRLPQSGALINRMGFNNQGATALAAHLRQYGATAAEIEAEVGPEFISGSTRLRSGTAQKLVLNQLSTLVMVRLGKTYGNLMVDVRATNAKLRDRAHRIVTAATGADATAVTRALAEHEGRAKHAILGLLTGWPRDRVDAELDRTAGVLRAAVPTPDK